MTQHTTLKLKVLVYNNHCKVLKQEPVSYEATKRYLTLKVNKLIKIGKKFENVTEDCKLYWEDPEGNLIFPRGLLDVMPKDFLDADHSNEVKTLADITLDQLDPDMITTILQPESGFDLRIDQVTAIKKIMLFKRGIAQLATGCFTGDTRVKLLDGSTPTLKELSEIKDWNDYVISASEGQTGVYSTTVGQGCWARKTRTNADIIELTFNDDSTLKCTPDHNFILLNGQIKEAQYLTSEDTLLTPSLNSGLIGFNNHLSVKSIKRAGTQDVYDLEVTNTGVFMVQTSSNKGIFVKNSGKTEIMSACLKLMNEIYGHYPKTLIIVPTSHLAKQTVKRLSKYGIPIEDYRSTRDINSVPVQVTHPKSLANDIKKNPDILKDIKVMMWDEAHHNQSDTYRSVYENAYNLEFSVALSASAIDFDKLSGTELHKFVPDEALVIGTSGRVLVNIPPSYYIKQGILATPVLCQLEYEHSEMLSSKRKSHWGKNLEATGRINLVAQSASYMAMKNRKILILVNTINQANLILTKLADLGTAKLARVGLGSNSNLKWVDEPQEVTRRQKLTDGTFAKRIEKVNIVAESEDIYEMFDNGDIKILIGTSHLDEGFDVPNLDVAILGGGGKSQRKTIQRIGRMLRKTKTGNYGYVIDFTDKGDKVLSKHSRDRLKLYRKIIGVPEHFIFEKMTLVDMKKKFLELEELS
ncbi:ATP-dependent helicase [Bacillus phage vB_BceM-HSE3]|nr:ATP-dependent helicase [Bacillus phage vB_BceM-HSE3]